MSRLKRSLELLNLLQSGHGQTVKSLAKSLGCSQRTIFRDIKLLNEMDVGIALNKRLGRYTVEHQAFISVRPLEDDELATLVIAATLSPISQLRPFSGKVDRAIAKLMNQSSWRLRNHIDRVVRALMPATEHYTLSVEESEIFSVLLKDIVGRRKVRIHWKQAADQGKKSTQFSPYQLVGVDSQCFVAGQATYGKIAQIALSEIRQVEQTDEAYEVPVEYLQDGDTGYRRTDLKQESRVKVPKTDVPSAK